MSERTLLIPILLIVVFGAPIVYHEMKSKQPVAASESAVWTNPQATPFSQASHSQFGQGLQVQPANFSNPAGATQISSTRNVSRPHSVPAAQPFQLATFPGKVDNPVQKGIEANSATSTSAFDPSMIPIRGQSANQASHSTPIASQTIVNPALAKPPFPHPVPTALAAVVAEPTDLSNMTPDYGAVETYVFPGNEFGPDLSAEPLENLPIQDFSEVFRFDLTKPWVQQRWKRISTNPADFQNGLSGMRIPLVTGTNSWDLHGSLTYYFDTRQNLQRITFRGWTGDPQKLLNHLTTQFQFKSQPTTLAGFYLGETRRKTHGGIMLKTPPVIDSNNRFQQYGIVMEMNRPDGPFELSDEYRRLIAGSHPQ